MQVAVLTVRIDALREHVKRHRKDHSSKRGLEALTNQRKKVLRYLRRKDFEAFRAIVKDLVHLNKVEKNLLFNKKNNS